MVIKVKIKGKEVNINIPDAEYWIKRNKQRINPYWEDADNTEKRLNKEYEKAYKQLEKELYTFIGKYGTDGQLTYSQNRIIALMKELKPHIDSLYEEEQIAITEVLTKVYEDNYYKGLYMLSSGIKVYSSFVGLNENAIKTAINFPWSGQNFSDRIYNNKNKLLVTLKEEITQSIIRGDSIQQTTRTVASRLNISKKNAGRLVQTEIGAVISESDKKMYSDFGLDKYEYVATLDDRTSETCKDKDGEVFKLEDAIIGVNMPPLHPL